MTLTEKQREAVQRSGAAPERYLTCEEIECPWCLADQTEECGSKDDHTCTECHKEFYIAEDEYGLLSAVGIITEADKAYLEWRASR